MPITGLHDPGVDLDKLDAAAPSMPIGQGVRNLVSADVGRMSRGAFHWLTAHSAEFAAQQVAALTAEPGDPLPGEYGYDDITKFLPTEAANAQYGVDGYLRFNAPITPHEAAWKNAEAQRRRYKDVVMTSSRPTPLTDMAFAIGGSLVDPVGLPLMVVSDGIGRAGMTAWELRAAGGVATATAKAGRVWNAAPRLLAQGAAVNAPYVALSAGLTQHAGEDYDMGDALRDIAFGAVVHTGFGLAGRGINAYLGSSKRRPGALFPDAEQGPPDLGDVADVPPAGRMPEAIEALPIEGRQGAFQMAVDQVIDGEPVTVGELVARELEPEKLDRLNDPTVTPTVESWRPLEEGVAVTPRGTEVKVRYGLVEMADLTTSHTNDLEVNPTFPAELQPRDRARAGAQARNHQLESEMNPKLLMRDVSAGAGAPIVSPEGVVESGNGRTIALRRSAANGTDAYKKYLAELEAQGFDATGMQQPVLVRMRTEPMNGAERAALARELNADVTERMSPAEQANADAARLGNALDLIPENGSLRDALFTKTVIERIAPDQIGVFVNKNGVLSKEGERRIRAAVVARAYGDEGLVGQIFEGEETATRKLGDALAEAAPQWAKMRSLAESNQIPEALDITPNLMVAVSLVREARTRGVSLSGIMAERLGQQELFGGEVISPASEAFVRLFFRDAEFTKPRAAEKVTQALKDYARQAGQVDPGINLFGEIPDEGTARAILRNVADKYGSGEAEAVDLRAPGRAASPEPAPVVYDVRKPGEDGGGSGRPGLSDEAGDGPGGEGGGARLTPEQIIAADPELKALADDNARMFAENGLVPEPHSPPQDPANLTTALQAAAVCLTEEGLG